MVDRNLTWKRQPKDIRDITFKVSRGYPSLKEWEGKVDYLSIWDQGQAGSCVAHAVNRGLALSLITQRKIDDRQANELRNTLSRAMTYWLARWYLGTTNYDSGCFIRDAMKALKTYGACSEKTLPYVPEDFSKRIPWYCYLSTIGHITRYERLPISVEAVKQAIAKNGSVVGGFDVYSNIWNSETEKTGLIPLPDMNSSPEGGHAVLYTGWNDQKRTVTFANSWGKEWGDEGYGYMPYAMFSERYQDDFTTIVS